MTKLKSGGWTDEEIEKISCPNGSLTCGLRTRLGFDDGKCHVCKKIDAKKENEVAQLIYNEINSGSDKNCVLMFIEKNWRVYNHLKKGPRRC